ncbi:helix-turn-helix transcriptional regulator [Actinoplanes sp. CA-030573]|uniref:helix-turn-helix transcriptional regulator n=1 Tax=Actinoplanes sp. CA-030573 TaxID=3239898 RepID=UPI003D8E1195
MPWESKPHAEIGRAPHLRHLERLVAGLRAGRGGAVAVTGEPGAGKTALLARLMERVPETTTVLATSGVESEAALPYAALGDLLRPLLTRRPTPPAPPPLPALPPLPPPQARALGAALALEDGPGFTPYALCMGVLNVLVGAARSRPVLVVVDDADAIDQPSATALLFAARRISDEPVAMVLAARSPIDGLSELPLTAPALARLTRRELQVARAVAGGLSNPEAATALRLSRKTVETHLSGAYRKLGVRSRTELVRYLIEADISRFVR